MDVNQMLQQTNAINSISRELGTDPGDRTGGRGGIAPVDPFWIPAARGTSRPCQCGTSA